MFLPLSIELCFIISPSFINTIIENTHVQKMPFVARNINKRSADLYIRDVQYISILVLALLSETTVLFTRLKGSSA